MIAPAGSEFIALCRSQVRLLTQVLGAASTVVYLAETVPSQGEPTLVPFVGYPDMASVWSDSEPALPPSPGRLRQDRQTSQGANPPNRVDRSGPPPAALPPQSSVPPEASEATRRPLSQAASRLSPLSPANSGAGSAQASPELVDSHQLVLPLTHDGVVLGVMVTHRDHPPWNPSEQEQAEAVAKTIAIGYVLDQRQQWLQIQFQQHQGLQVSQSETFHDLLHQFRNPLTALRTFGKLLLKRVQPDEPNYGVATSIVRESERLQELVQYFEDAVQAGDGALETTANRQPSLELRLPAGDPPPANRPLILEGADGAGAEWRAQDQRMEAASHRLGRDLALQPGHIRDILTPLLLSAENMAEDRQIRLISHLPPDLPPVQIDPGALREVFSNLIDNALKYSPPGAVVWVTAGLWQPQPDQTLQGVAVGDTGMGIPTLDQPRIFERYYRGTQAEGAIPGTGLGLAIARELVQGMGGHLELYSPAALSQVVPPQAAGIEAGPGTVFVVWLPQA